MAVLVQSWGGGREPGNALLHCSWQGLWVPKGGQVGTFFRQAYSVTGKLPAALAQASRVPIKASTVFIPA